VPKRGTGAPQRQVNIVQDRHVRVGSPGAELRDINDIMPNAWVVPTPKVLVFTNFSPPVRTLFDFEAGIATRSSSTAGHCDPQALSSISTIASCNRANGGQVTPSVSGDCSGECSLGTHKVASDGLWAAYTPGRSHGPTGYDGGGASSSSTSKGSPGKGYGAMGAGKGKGGGKHYDIEHSASAAGFVNHRNVYVDDDRPSAAGGSSHGRGPSRGPPIGSYSEANRSRASSRR
jgi:hypothetical protein